LDSDSPVGDSTTTLLTLPSVGVIRDFNLMNNFKQW